jgi:NADH-quinone oxidoreductase subunit E
MTESAKILSPALLSTKVRNEIDAWLKKYPPERRQSAVIKALSTVQ